MPTPARSPSHLAPVLPHAVKLAVKRVDRALPWDRIHTGDQVQCPCCGGSFARFRSLGQRPGARCPGCGSLERHRALWLYLNERTDLLERALDVLHFAPEVVFEDRFRALPGWRYVAADLYPSSAHQVRVDITAISFPADAFDLIICNHVLVEVPDDVAAVRELHRVLRPGGLLITQVPVDERRATTPPPSAPPSRFGLGQRLGGQNLRIYGRDYPDLLQAAGFGVEQVPYADEVGPEAARRYGLVEAGAAAKGNAIHLAVKAPA